MATSDKGDGKGRTFKTAQGKAMQADLAKILNDKAFKDHTHAGHMSAVTKAYNTYRKLHASK